MPAAPEHLRSILRATACCGALAAGIASAAPADPVTIEPAPVPVPPGLAASAVPAAAVAPETGLKRTVVEDDNVRIEETRLRGLPTRITVRNKSTGGSSYEILTAPNGKDPTQDKGVAGQRAWSLFDF